MTVHAGRVHPSLHDTRQRLTAEQRSSAARFTSIHLEHRSRREKPTVRPQETVTVRLGVVPGPPIEMHGYLFCEDTGCLWSETAAHVESASANEVLCSFVLPEDLPSEGVCVLIEGRWPNGLAGCEMTFSVHD